jgi:hypothetical protein
MKTACRILGSKFEPVSVNDLVFFEEGLNQFDPKPDARDIGATKSGFCIRGFENMVWAQIAQHRAMMHKDDDEWISFLYQVKEPQREICGYAFEVNYAYVTEPEVYRGECTTFPFYVNYKAVKELDGSPEGVV